MNAYRPLDLYATGARDATDADCDPRGCPVCLERIHPGQRVADLENDGRAAHLHCIALAAEHGAHR